MKNRYSDHRRTYQVNGHRWVANGCKCHVACLNCEAVTERVNIGVHNAFACEGKKAVTA